MEEEPKVEVLINIIKLQEKALEYYADGSIYSGMIENIQILKDRGHQARFALEQSKKIRNYELEMIKSLEEALKENNDLNNIEGIDDDIIDKINKFKNIFNKL